MGLSSDWLEHLVRKPALSFCIGNWSSRVSTGPSAEKSIDSLEASPLVQSVKQTSWRLCSSTTDSIDRLETSLQSYRIYRQAGDIAPVLQNLLTAWRHRSSPTESIDSLETSLQYSESKNSLEAPALVSHLYTDSLETSLQ